MKKLLLLFIASALVSGAALAQTDPKKDYKKDRTEWENKLKTELNLTADQSVKFDDLNKEYNEKLDAIAMDATTTDKETLKEKKMGLKKEKEAKLLAFLTAEQQTKYKELIEKKKREMEAKPSGN